MVSDSIVALGIGQISMFYWKGNMYDFIKKIISLLSKKERSMLLRLCLVIVIVAIFELAGIASLLPFMTVVGSPEMIERNRYLHWAYEMFGFSSANYFLIGLGLLVFIMIMLSSALKCLLVWFDHKFFHSCSFGISQRLLYNYLHRPYIYYLNVNTMDLGKNVLHEVSMLIHGVIRNCTNILSQLTVVFFILIFLLIVDPVLAFIIVLFFGASYSIIYLIVEKNLSEFGKRRFEANRNKFKAASEAFGGIKDLKVLNRERFFFDYYSSSAKQVENNLIIVGLVSSFPRQIMEVLSFGGILIIVLYFLILRQDIGLALPIMSLYAFAGYRLLPAVQSIYSSIGSVRFHLPALNTISQDLSGLNEIPASWGLQVPNPMKFQDIIKLESITFTYPGANHPAIRGLSLMVKKNTIVGLVGETGCGKTTLIDIILGLLAPQKGVISVDDVFLSDITMPSWQIKLGYVPQSIFLSDDSIMGNIAFGVSTEKIDIDAVERASKLANLHNFIVNELEEGYSTNVGERGVRLSGGQRQRIGIARALYHDPEILIMDEATSALDSITEESVIQAIRNLAGKKTIIAIAHRVVTLKDCDIIYVLDNGKIVEQGTYDELLKFSSRFKLLAKTSESSIES